MRTLIAIPVYNEQKYVRRVLDRVLRHAENVLVVDDGSTDETPRLLSEFPIDQIRHRGNRGYGRSLVDAFRWSIVEGYDWLITMDCDEQHEPAAIPGFIDAAAADDCDIISGSRYFSENVEASSAPGDRRKINQTITAELNCRLSSAIGCTLTDAFCGFKAYRVQSLREMALTETGYAFPMQFWVQAAAARMRVKELPVKLIYNDPNRSFGGNLDNPDTRLNHYREVLHSEILRQRERLPVEAMIGLDDAPMCACGVPARAGEASRAAGSGRYSSR